MDKKTIIAKIAGIKKSAGNLQANIVLVEIASMEHAKAHGDSTLLTRLIQALPQGVRVKALVKHIVDHTPYKFDDKLNVFVKPKKTAKTFLIDEARKVPFYEYTKETVSAFDIDKAIQSALSLQSRYEKAIEKGQEIKGDVAKLEAVVQQLSAIKV
tara:strand:- start:92 stop:559 length:468 start_codon:yes stop_codon:yes gene_type:complete